MFYIKLLLGLIIWNWSRYCCATEEDDARAYMAKADKEIEDAWNKVQQASWDYETNINEENLAKETKAKAAYDELNKKQFPEISKFNWKFFKDDVLRREFEDSAYLGFSVLSEKDSARFEELTGLMTGRYSSANICSYKDPKKCDLSLDPDLQNIMSTSRDERELKYTWIEWRNQTKSNRGLFQEYVTLLDKIATENKFKNPVEFWMWNDHYLTDDNNREAFTKDIEDLWNQLKPLYQELHAFTRNKLRAFYNRDGVEIVSERGPIPAHLLGNMWAQEWEDIYRDLINPFPDDPILDITAEMVKQKYTPMKMVDTAEAFFVSLGLQKMTDDFRKNSLLEKPTDGRQVVCSASAWDFANNEIFRIKMCADITATDLYAVHHEMTHIENYMEYRNLPFVLKKGTNEGFQEAIADSVAMTVNTPQHLNKIGLLADPKISDKSDLSYLFLTLVTWYPLLPIAYVMDLWRWDVYRGTIKPENYNCEWWKRIVEIQGVMPPVERTEDDFDPAAKYHINAGSMYIKYFVGIILQYQFYQAMCIAAGQFDPKDPQAKPLHKCDIYGSTKAGDVLKPLLQVGISKLWPDVLEKATGTRKMDPQPFLNYFGPILDYIKAENEKSKVHVGWDIPTSNICRPPNI